MASKTEICNLALKHIGHGKPIANVDTEQSAEAAACRAFYDISLDEMERDFPWHFTTKIVALALIETEPNDEWSYSYRAPTDALFYRRILSGTRNDSRDSRVPYRVVHDASGVLIYTDEQDAELEYTLQVTNANMFPRDFQNALALKIALYILPQILKGRDLFRMTQVVEFKHNRVLAKAQKNAANEEQPEEPPDSEFILARDA
jgi:hypothetical protein